MGYPEWWDHSRDSRKKNFKNASTAAITETKTDDDHKKLLALAAAAGNDDKFLNISTPVSNSAWIIDSGATEHMTFDSRQISPIKPFSICYQC